MKALVRAFAALGLLFAVDAHGADGQTSAQGQNAWQGCCGAAPWSQAGPMMRGGGMHGMMGRGAGGSMSRHRAAMMGGVPAAYANLRNPLPVTQATIERGAAVYAANCASCHGARGLGDGPDARTLRPRPADLAWLSNMPMSGWDPFMYWTIAEGGAQFETGMPAFKDSLSKDDIWAVTAYIQAHLPQAKAGR
jgi:mono/diheme cytochrome c family protein